jgi:glycosyltransferase involved in cell wall biosynthesis
MNILMISGGRGGVYKFTYEVVSRLSRKSYNFFVIFATGSKNLMGPQLKDIPFIFLNDLTSWGNMGSFLRSFDIIHSNFAAPIPFLSVMRKPIMFTCHGLPQPWLEIGFKEKLLFSIEKLIFPLGVKKATTVVSVSKFVRNQIASAYNIPSQVIYHGINLADYHYITYDKSECKKILHLNPQEKIILYVGKLHPYKDPITLVKSFGVIAKKQNKIRLILVGMGKLCSHVLKLAKNLQVLDKLSIRSWLKSNELALLYRAADVFVLPSINEAFGMVILEAMASGTPCIVSNSGACPEIVQDCGLIFKQGNHQDLAEKILKVLEDDNLAQTLALKGYERVRKVFSWEKAVTQYEKLYSRLIKC